MKKPLAIIPSPTNHQKDLIVRSFQTAKNLGRRRRGRSPFDPTSKIGDMRGDFRAILLAKSLPYAEERPGGALLRPVTERKPSRKSGRSHFFDTLRT